MPLYEFACHTCGQSFEKKMRMSQVEDGQTCPSCGGQETRRRFSTAVAVRASGRAANPAPSPGPFT